MLRVRRLGSRYVDLELTVGKNRRARVIERPGLWMAPEETDRIVTDLRRVVRAAVPAGTLDYGVLTGDKDRLDRAVLTILYEGDTRRPIGFNAMSFMDLHLRGRPEEVLHLGLVVVNSEFRSRGLSWALYGLSVLLLSFQRQFRPLWVSNVTQVPAVVGMVAENFTETFPTPDPASRRSHRHLVIARQIMSAHRHVFGVGPDAGFDPQRFVVTNAYTGGSDNLKKTFEDAPKHRVEKYNAMCRELLDYSRGDDFLQIGRFTFADARRFLLRSVPRGSLGAILGHGTFLSLGSIFLPLLHWFTPWRQSGDLRPWKESRGVEAMKGEAKPWKE